MLPKLILKGQVRVSSAFVIPVVEHWMELETARWTPYQGAPDTFGDICRRWKLEGVGT